MVNLGRHSRSRAEQYDDDAFWEGSAEIHVRARFPRSLISDKYFTPTSARRLALKFVKPGSRLFKTHPYYLGGLIQISKLWHQKWF